MIDTKSLKPEQYISIPPEYAQQLKARFERYAQLFRKPGNDEYNKHMELKQQHTLRVVIEIVELGKALGMHGEQLAFLEVIALLHDVARFEQFDAYNTFADAESENHAEMAIRVIEKEKFLSGLATERVEIVYRAILNHNMREVPSGESELVDFYSRVLRDADKLDIWRVAIQYNIFHKLKNETFPTTYEVPKVLLLCFKEQKNIDLDQVDSFYDSILFRLSWVFDLNFRYSIQQFHARNYASDFLRKIPESSDIKRIESYLEQYVSMHK